MSNLVFWLPIVFMVLGGLGGAIIIHLLEKKYYPEEYKGSHSDDTDLEDT